MIWQSLSLWALRVEIVLSCLINERCRSGWAMELRDSLVTRWLWRLRLCVLWEALQVDMCNKSKLIISWREQQLCLHPYRFMLTFPSEPSRSVRLEDLLIVHLNQLLNAFIKVLKIYFMSFFQDSEFSPFIHSYIHSPNHS